MSDKYRVGKTVTNVAVAHAAQSAFSTASVPINGILWLYKTKITANSDAAATFTLNLIDSDGDTVFSKSAISGTSGTTITNLTGDNRVALQGFYTVQIVFSANQTVTDNSATITLMMDKG